MDLDIFSQCPTFKSIRHIATTYIDSNIRKHLESLGLVNPEYQLEYDLISLSEKYRLPFNPQHFQSLSQPSVQTVEFELDSLSHDSRIVFKLKARNLLDRNDVVATSVLDLLDEKLHLREGSFRLLMWLNDFVDEKNRYQSYGRFICLCRGRPGYVLLKVSGGQSIVWYYEFCITQIL